MPVHVWVFSVLRIKVFSRIWLIRKRFSIAIMIAKKNCRQGLIEIFWPDLLEKSGANANRNWCHAFRYENDMPVFGRCRYKVFYANRVFDF